MEQDTQKIIEERFKELPETIREVITESGWEKIIREIVSKNNLRIDQGGIIENETLLIMLGFETPEDYLNNLIQEAKLSQEIALKVSQEVNEKIFSLIRNRIIEKTESEEVVPQNKNPLEREAILKEIEDKDETEVMIPSAVSTPSTQVNTAEQNQKIIGNSLTQKLQNPTISQPTVMKVDPYRELPM
jgi:hypothetical protein